MAHGDIEMEIKVRVENAKPLIAFLEKNGDYKGEARQVDEYFTPAHKDYLSTLPVKEWFRIREEEKGASINYKNYHYDENGKSTFCDEFESAVSDIRQVRKILNALGVRSLTKVDKLRKTWDYNEYEVAIDEVVGLGTYVEIEFKGASKDYNKIYDGMVKFLKDIGVGKIERNYQGYPFILLFPEKVEDIEV
jgi:adenylate cyclase class 2